MSLLKFRNKIKPKFIEYFFDIAERTSKLSTALKLKVGAVIVKDNRILSIGYNGTPSGWSNECESIEFKLPGDVEPTLVTKPEVLHAEANALMKLTKSTESSEGAILFCTHEPCLECAKLIYQAGISHVYYIHGYTSQKCGSGVAFLKEAQINVTKR
jgi:dCMP deaminase